MDTPKFQSSFIPNKDTQGPPQSPLSGGIMYTIGIMLFVIAVVASIGVYAYQKYLEQSISGMEQKLTEARASLDPEFVTKITQTNSRFISASSLISKHQVPTAFFALLQSLTLGSVRFSSLAYTMEKDGNVKIDMKGTAKSYATVAAQAKVFGDNAMVIDPQFSDLDLNKEGDVVFAFQAKIDKKVLSYEKLITGTEGGAQVENNKALNTVVEKTAPLTLIATSTPASSTPVSPGGKGTSTQPKKP